MSDGRPWPLHVITGFLGSGKTTLLRRILSALPVDDAVVLINEFGEAGLDHRLVRHVNEATVVLENGCACCALRHELRSALYDLFARRRAGDLPPFNRVILETSGLADPAPILYTIQADEVLNAYLRTASITTTVDAVNGERQLDRHGEAVKQLAAADHVVVTKTDLAEDGRTRALIERLRAIDPAVRPLLGVASDFRPEAVLDDRRALLPPIPSEIVGASHRDRIRSFTLTYDAPIDWDAFAVWLTMLLNRHGERVLRVKGILSITDSDTPVVIHGVQHIASPPVHLPAWPDDDRRSRIVFILDELDLGEIRASLDRVLRRAGTIQAATGR